MYVCDAGPFIAMENFHYTAQFLGLPVQPTLEEIAAAGQHHCSKGMAPVYLLSTCCTSASGDHNKTRCMWVDMCAGYWLCHIPFFSAVCI